MKDLAIVLTICFATVAFGTAQSKEQEEQGFYALARADFGDVYSDDGCGCGTVTYKGELVKAVRQNLIPDVRVKAVVDLREAAIPLLIEHLDDTRPTKTLFKGKPTPLGHIALDILTHVIPRNSREVLIVDCPYDGLGACIQNGYYFRPDASAEEMRKVKRNWQQLYRRGSVGFEYPRWWR